MPAGTLYRGREGMWSWVAHRVTGVLIFLLPVRTRPRHRSRACLPRGVRQSRGDLQDRPSSRAWSTASWPAILFHALNGLRIIAVDFWSKGPRLQKQMLWTVVVIWLVLMVGALYPVLGHAARELFGS
ncbi:succinate dehydrogenase, cytochrome b556 subunit [Streptomyces violascens]|uniref:succinate dehydrogenase, cytochrome b556 subunit n=1 Tax=Streptomyces violascens TaxID=67381 RepID=UPI001CFCF18A|nr:succinate dehydrogenase, cytochrome b556 subunit [Streptomyces violascens]